MKEKAEVIDFNSRKKEKEQNRKSIANSSDELLINYYIDTNIEFINTELDKLSSILKSNKRDDKK